MIRATLPALFLSGLAAGAAARPQADAPWSSQVVMNAPAKLGGCAVGDLDPEHAGNEIVSVCVTGQVFLSRVTKGRWVNEPIVEAPGELLQCAIGDADPRRPGNELVVVGVKTGTEDGGAPGMAYLIHGTTEDVDGRTRLRWKRTPLLEDGALLHAVTIGDVDPDHDGDEIVVAGFSKTVHVITQRGSGWAVTPACTYAGNVKSLVPFAGGVAVACDDGRLVHLAKEDGAWRSRTLDQAERGYARLGASPDRLVAARDDGKLVLVDADGNVTEIYAERQKLRGAVIADLDPTNAGLELATAGYERKMTVAYRVGEGTAREWIPRLVHTDVDRFHHLAVGELDPTSPGPELVGCGYSGRLIVAGKSGE